MTGRHYAQRETHAAKLTCGVDKGRLGRQLPKSNEESKMSERKIKEGKSDHGRRTRWRIWAMRSVNASSHWEPGRHANGRGREKKIRASQSMRGRGMGAMETRWMKRMKESRTIAWLRGHSREVKEELISALPGDSTSSCLR